MKFYESKAAKFLAGKGFYIVLAVCMAVIGVAAYSAMDASLPKAQEDENSSISDDEAVIPSVPVEPQSSTQAPQRETNDQSTASPADTEEQAPYFVVPIGGSVTKPFSNTALLYSETFKDMRIHTGADITPEFATTVVAAYSGIVQSVEENTPYGTVVTIDHGDGVVLKYCGVKNVTVVKGDVVNSEEIIAEISVVQNECAEGEHLHLELILNGEYADPMSLFGE